MAFISIFSNFLFKRLGIFIIYAYIAIDILSINAINIYVMKKLTNKWDSAFLFYVPKFVALAIFVALNFTPDSWTTPMVIVGFAALAIGAVLDILRYRHIFAKQEEEEEEGEEKDTPSHDQAKKSMSKWDKIIKWGEVADSVASYTFLAWAVGALIFIFCVYFVLPWFK